MIAAARSKWMVALLELGRLWRLDHPCAALGTWCVAERKVRLTWKLYNRVLGTVSVLVSIMGVLENTIWLSPCFCLYLDLFPFFPSVQVQLVLQKIKKLMPCYYWYTRQFAHKTTQAVSSTRSGVISHLPEGKVCLESQHTSCLRSTKDALFRMPVPSGIKQQLGLASVWRKYSLLFLTSKSVLSLVDFSQLGLLHHVC